MSYSSPYCISHASLCMWNTSLDPAPQADRRTLIRRAYLDLTGLLPPPEAVEAFVKDPAPDAYGKLIDRLLASPNYGERWGRFWLDVVRYADSSGFEFDINIDNAWRYRDYVIKAFNEDKPYGQFVVEQLAVMAKHSSQSGSTISA